MAEAKFTPGPWEVSRPISPEHPWIDAACNLTPSPNGDDYYMSVSGICNAADASLITAAPDLYEALETAELGIQELCNGQHPENECWNTLKTVRAALAKARGDANG
jgi:hypothetical protein